MPEIWFLFVEAAQKRQNSKTPEPQRVRATPGHVAQALGNCDASSLLHLVRYPPARWSTKVCSLLGNSPNFTRDLRDSSFKTTLPSFHQRYSTNTQPSWDLAQPFRHVAHNGEINTIISNRRWLRAKQRKQRASLKVGPWFQALEPDVSDSGKL